MRRVQLIRQDLAAFTNSTLQSLETVSTFPATIAQGGPGAAAPANRSSAKSLLIQENPGQSRPFYGRGAACQVFLTRPGYVNAEIRPDE
jgi:hypothetical protein